MNILLTGIDGYMGWPIALRLSKEFPNARIIGVDNLARRAWIEECKAVSAIPVMDMDTRLLAANEHGFNNIEFIMGDLADRAFTYDVLDKTKPNVILHAASQPSAPYSHIDGEHANYTQQNNTQSTRNLLWGMKEKDLLDTHFIETTTTGVYGAPEFEIPEGYFEVEHKGQKDTIPFPGMGGSWYHVSKCHDVTNLLLSSRMWKLPITDLRTSIVYGTDTEETLLDPRLATRFDFDFYFGVVVNRFCAMAMAGYPITIYGKGEQKKPQISLEDAVRSLVNAVKLKPTPGLQIFNQTTECISIGRIAKAIQAKAKTIGLDVSIEHIPNPRVEKEEHDMHMANEKFLELLDADVTSLEDQIESVLNQILPYKDTFIKYQESFIPKGNLKQIVKGT